MSYGGISQDEFIAILFADNQYTTSAQRKGWLQKRFGVSFADELTVAQKSKAIDMLKSEKEPAYRGWCEHGHEKGQRGCALCEDLI